MVLEAGGYMRQLQLEDALQLIRLEYEEMPGLRLTPWQMQRLWDLPTGMCDQALAMLTTAGYLLSTTDGAYERRASYGWVPGERKLSAVW
jgi:hypothetical protein